MIHQFLINNFGLPAGGLYSNLIASGICFVLAAVWAHHKIVKPLRSHQRRVEELHAKTMARIVESDASLHERISFINRPRWEPPRKPEP